MSIQQDVLDTIGSEGIAVESLLEAVGNVGPQELQVTVNALSRARRIQVVEGRYQVVSAKRPLGDMPHTGRPPTAQEEAAASLLPMTRVCVTCGGAPQALCEFRLVGPGNARALECNTCHGKKSRAGMAKKRGQIATLNPTMGASAVSPQTPHESNSPEAADSASGSAGIQFHSAQREISLGAAHGNGQAVEVAREAGNLQAAETLRPSEAKTVEPDGPRHSVIGRVHARRQVVLNQIAVLEVEVQKLQAELGDLERFGELYERFSIGVEK